MEPATITVGAPALPLGDRRAGRLAWSLSAVSILVAAISLAIALRAAVASGNFRSILTHQSLTPFITTGFAFTGALVASRRPRNPIGWIFVAVGLLYALTALSAALYNYESPSSPIYPWAAWFGYWLWLPAVILPLTFVLLLFPDGRLPAPRWRWVAWAAALGLAGVVLVVMLHPGPLESWGMHDPNPFGLPGAGPFLERVLNIALLLLVAGIGGSFAAFALRFRRSRGSQREQIKWLAYALGLMLGVYMLSAAAWLIWPEITRMEEVTISLTNLGILGIVAAAAIAILRHRLYDINLIINRTLVYTTLSVGVAGLYGLVIGALGALFQTRGNLIVALVATGLAAVLIQPARDGLQRLVNHLMYGERDDPYAVLSQLSRRLEGSLSPEAALPAVVESVSQALRLPYVAVALLQDGDFRISASAGKAGEEWVQLPLIYQGETVGQLRLSPRGPNESFTPGEQRLLRDIARQVGITAHNQLLTQDLRQLAHDLQRSRERLVTAREEERRRLRRDLHDGLGPVLASQGLKLAALQKLGKRDPQVTAKLLDQLIAQNERLVTDIRRLVYDLRPPALDELGLVEAIRDQIVGPGEDIGERLPVRMAVEAPPGGLPPLPAAVEVAAYRIALEAITNVYRHARAERCTLRFSIDAGGAGNSLVLEVSDDGAGLPQRIKPGVGLRSMRERAEEVGGQCVVQARPGGGTTIVARFPLAQ